MKRYKFFLIAFTAIMILFGLGLQNYVAGIWSSWVDYETPLAKYKPGESGYTSAHAIGKRVIVILIDGARPDVIASYSSSGAYLTLNQQGVVFKNAYAVTPTYSVPARAAISTGLPHELSGVSSNWYGGGVLQLPSIFSLAHDAGLRVAAVGDESIEGLFGDYLDVYVEIEEEEGHMVNALNAAEQLIDSSTPPDLLWIGLADIDHYGHYYGANSDKYRDAVAESSQLIQGLIDLLRDKGWINETLLVLISDHGHLDRGGHGGEEEIVKRIYLGLLGGGVRSGVEVSEDVYYMSVAPTIAVYLGLDPKLISSTPPLYQAFDKEYIDRFAKYTSILAKNYLDTLNYLIDAFDLRNEHLDEVIGTIRGDINKASDLIEKGDFQGGIQSALEAFSKSQDLYQDIRDLTLDKTAVLRLSITGFIGFVSIALLYVGYRYTGIRLLLIGFLSSIVMVIAFWASFVFVFNYTTTMSAVNEVDDYLMAIMFSTIISVVIGAISLSIAALKSKVEGEKLPLIFTLTITTVLIGIFIFGIPTINMMFSYGYRVVFPFPNWTVGYLYYTSVLTIMFLSLFNWVIPLILALAFIKK